MTQHTECLFPEQLRMFIGGMGGTGKTQVLKALIRYFDIRGESHRLTRVAPTGTASSLIGGSTYHYMFGINEFTKGEISKKTLGEVKGRMDGVEYVFFDEVSMLSCSDLYKISARLAMCTNNADLMFGGMNMIFAGDFAQLPPVIGSENAALYRLDNGMYATNKKGQEAALGKAIWHQVTTVVILRQNMRQNTQSVDDAKMRTALANMRYKMCTVADIGFLRTRICNISNKSPDILSASFRNVSIITGLNVHKDEFNRIGSIRFAAETGQELTDFYSDDTISDAPTSTARNNKQSTVNRLSGRMQRILWEARPSDNNKHISGKLSLCKGLPVMIRLNSATELCITKGQEGTVHSWVEGVGNKGQRVLETLFVRISNPPRNVTIAELPENVVPLIRTSSAITCSLPDDSNLSINRSQVEVIPNFAMTDYCSQGKTQPKNPVDLTNCRSHQSYYTALSRSATAEGTLLLPDFTDPRLPALNPRKIQGGCSGHLRQEFRELELLDYITLLLYEGTLPPLVFGDRRYDLLTRFQSHVGNAFVPPSMERPIVWGTYDPLHPTECSTFEWDVKSMPHVLNSVLCDGDDSHLIESVKSCTIQDTSLTQGSINPEEMQGVRAESPVQRRSVSPAKCPGKRKDRPECDNNSPADVTSKKRQINRYNRMSLADPVSCAWYNNSCPFDSLIFVIANVWRSDPRKYSKSFSEINSIWMGNLSTSLTSYTEGKYSLEQVRDYMRRKLHREFSSTFIYGKETSPGAVAEKWFTSQTPFMTVSCRCDNGHVTRAVNYFSCGISPLASRDQTTRTIQQYLTSTKTYGSGIICSECGNHTIKHEKYHLSPSLLPVYIEGSTTVPEQTFTLHVEGEDVMYVITGVVYYGAAHFTARYVDDDGIVWFNDGYIHRRTAMREVPISDVDMSVASDGRKPVLVMYKRIRTLDGTIE